MNQPQPFQRGAIFISWAIGACIITLAALMFHDLYARLNRPPPFEFSAAQYVAERQALCPGDELRWKSSLIVREAPTVLVVARVIWSIPLARAWKPASTVDVFVWTEMDKGQPVSRQSAFRLPPDLPSGQYQLRVGATSFNSQAGAYAVPFSVLTTCKGPA